MDDHSSANAVADAVQLPTRAFGLKVPCGGFRQSVARLERRSFPQQGPYSALLRVGLAIPSRLPGPWWALTPPFHHHPGSAKGTGPCGLWPPAPGQSLLCGAFPGVAPAGHYPAPFFHGVRTFLEAALSRLGPAVIQPSARVSFRRDARPWQAIWAGRRPPRSQAAGSAAATAPATPSARARSWAVSGPLAQGANRSRKASSSTGSGALG
jgi:hypothetical protein